jgi:hypothetical protein
MRLWDVLDNRKRFEFVDCSSAGRSSAWSSSNEPMLYQRRMMLEKERPA